MEGGEGKIKSDLGTNVENYLIEVLIETRV